MIEESVAISLEDVSLFFYKNESDNFTFKKSLLSGKFFPEKKTVFENFNLKVNNSTILGIEGSNGVGKTTLLSAIAGLLPISSGKILVNGKILPLLGLGHVFHNDLDISKNIELWNLSFKSNFKVEKNFVDKILFNAGLNVNPKTLIRSLSSGMKSRLAFELALNGSEDILLLDEVFAVGDKEFRNNAIKRMKEKISSLKCAIIVSHDSEILKNNCNKIIRIIDKSSFEEV